MATLHLKPKANATLHGILLLGGDHRDLGFQAASQEPKTPPPLSGRQHCNVQTETWLEDIADYEVELINTAMQCEAIYDEPLAAAPLTFAKDGEETSGTQLDKWIFSELEHAFDQVVVNLADAVIIESLRQLQEEFELDALRKQSDFHKCVRNRELGILAKYRAAMKKYEEQKKYLAEHKSWEDELDKVIRDVNFDKIRNIAPDYYVQNENDRAVYELITYSLRNPLDCT